MTTSVPRSEARGVNVPSAQSISYRRHPCPRPRPGVCSHHPLPTHHPARYSQITNIPTCSRSIQLGRTSQCGDQTGTTNLTHCHPFDPVTKQYHVSAIYLSWSNTNWSKQN